MPVASLYLLSLTTSATTFLHALRTTRTILLSSRPRHIIIHPTILDPAILTTTPWDLLILIQPPSSPNTPPIPPPLHSLIKTQYHLTIGIPSNLLTTYATRNASLQHSAPSIPLTGSLDHARRNNPNPSAQTLDLSPFLLSFMDELTLQHPGPVTMLNLLHFHHPDGKKRYYQYGQAFIPVAGKRGGNAKIVGNVVKPKSASDAAMGPVEVDSRGDWSRKEEEWWNEISIVHYPSIRHFCDMLAGEDYQEINERFRVAAFEGYVFVVYDRVGGGRGGGGGGGGGEALIVELVCEIVLVMGVVTF
ncbi:uncharacterized protein BO80DRAFT_495891 [Aspergillus ibericus CBS 121593]|uniref:Uncharacterized protein n=1 Tax=Aspergillus ibericus CBS 121593 TaxID=1448316 RepID=A0A395GQS6_9EURO|nr:hypothetical protein BO80DRAFT_495891 [Aspergillus ibericus CBS 121593]RAK97900.1 hypothetical protein BO80DRAFT_495891 [Aspergillus ibericus CBS 121593]